MITLSYSMAQSPALDDFQTALRDQIRQGGSVNVFLATVAALMAFGVLAYVVAEWRRRARLGPLRSDPQRMYVHLLDRLKLTREQRDWLVQLATASKLRHPTALLLVESLFDHHAAATLRSVSGQTGARPKIDVAELRRRLFTAPPLNSF